MEKAAKSMELEQNVEGQAGHDCDRDVRISRLKEAFEHCQTRLRQLKELPELSTIFPIGEKLEGEYTKPEFVRTEAMYHRKRLELPPTIRNNKVSCNVITNKTHANNSNHHASEALLTEQQSPINEINQRDIKAMNSPNHRDEQCVTMSDGSASRNQSGYEQGNTAVQHIRIAHVESLCPQTPIIVQSAQGGVTTAAYSRCRTFQEGTTAWYPPQYPAAQWLSSFVQPYQHHPYYQYPVSLPQSNPYVHSTPLLSRASHDDSVNTCRITRGEFWFPSDTGRPSNGATFIQPSPSRQLVTPVRQQPGPTMNKSRYANVRNDNFQAITANESSLQIHSYCSLSASCAYLERDIYGSPMAKKARIASF